MNKVELCRELRRLTGAPLSLCAKAAELYSNVDEAIQYLYSVSSEYIKKVQGRTIYRYLTSDLSPDQRLVIAIHTSGSDDMSIRSDQIGIIFQRWVEKNLSLLGKVDSGLNDLGTLVGSQSIDDLQAELRLNTREEFHISKDCLVTASRGPEYSYLYMHGQVGESNLKGGVYLSTNVQNQGLREAAVNLHAAMCDSNPYARRGIHRMDRETLDKLLHLPTVVGEEDSIGDLMSKHGLSHDCIHVIY